MLTAMLYDLWTAMRRAQVNRRTVAELSALDDRLLRDIGLCRGEIGMVAGGIPGPQAARAPTARPDAPLQTDGAPAAATCG